MAAHLPSVIPNENNQVLNCQVRSFQVVVAATPSMGVGKNGKLPWRLPSDMNFFKELTVSTFDPHKKNAVIMGRKTWESIPSKHRPLPGRLNVVLSSSKNLNIATTENIMICSSMDSALKVLATSPYCYLVERVFVIGGGQVLRDTLNGCGCDAIHFTDIEREYECDTFIPAIDHSLFQLWYSSPPLVENNVRYSFNTYVRIQHPTVSSIPCQVDKSGNQNEALVGNCFSYLPRLIFERHEEYSYVKLVRDIIAKGVQTNAEEGMAVLSKFACQLHFNLRKSFPLLASKNIFWQGIVEELLWSISGSTLAKDLQEKGIHKWVGSTSRAFNDSIGFQDREDGDLGSIYGFQLRHFGAKYMDMHVDCDGNGFYQLNDVIEKIKRNPENRQIILLAWNSSDHEVTSVPPFCMFAQFYVANGELSCQVYKCSGDMELEVPCSIAYCSLLTCIIAHTCDLQPGDLVLVLGDAHVRKIPLEDQLEKKIRPFPVLRINPQKKDLNSFVAEDFELIGFDPQLS